MAEKIILELDSILIDVNNVIEHSKETNFKSKYTNTHNNLILNNKIPYKHLDLFYIKT